MTHLDSVSAQRSNNPRRNVTVHLAPLWIAFICLVAIVGLIVVPGTGYIIFGFFFSYVVISVSTIYAKWLGRDHGKVLVWAAIVRLLLVLAIEMFPPTLTPGELRYGVSGIIWKDEGYYWSTARWLGESLRNFQQIDLGDPFERIAGYYALFVLLFSNDTVWGRLANVLVSALTSVTLYDALIRVTREKTRPWVYWLAIASPVLLLFSIVYLKEALLVFGVSLIMNATVRLYLGSRLGQQFVKLLVGSIFVILTREAVLAPLMIVLVYTLVFPQQREKQGNRTFTLLLAGFTTVALIMLTSLIQIAEFLTQLTGIRGLATLLTAETLSTQSDVGSVPLFDVVAQLPNPLRSLGFTFFTMLSPVITSVWHLLPGVGKPDWYVFSIAAYAISWWFCLPFLVRTGYDAIRDRNSWWFLWTAILILWIILASNARFGIGYDAFRYRDALTPVILLLAVKGLDTTLYLRSRRWKQLLKFYTFLVVSVILINGLAGL